VNICFTKLDEKYRNKGEKEINEKKESETEE